jgi:hypothetical protein
VRTKSGTRISGEKDALEKSDVSRAPQYPEKALLAGETCLAAHGSEFRRDRDWKARGRDPYARSCGVSPRIYILNRLALGARV